MNKKYYLIMIFTIFYLTIFCFSINASEKQLSITTGPMGGGFYPMGGGIAEYLSKNIPDLFITAVSSGGVDENLNRLDRNEADMGLVSTGDAYIAFQGETPYDHPYNQMSGMGILFGNWVEPYALKTSNINSYLDLKDKIVCAGSPGGSMHKIFYEICEFHGINPEKDFKKTIFLAADAAVQAIKMGQVDVVMEIAAIPTAGLTELSLTHDFQILQFAPGLRDKLVDQNPKYLAMDIPAGTY
ncbi:MAG: TAXI family TRAP transporter solute-binding subunit, partial [Atribacterota bacterium]|nr:TAXI family TRAP transporter solute-binding subunit [Atribacterota bacterium]